MHTETYSAYIRLKKELDELTAKNLNYSQAAQKVSKLMNALWSELSETEREEIDSFHKELQLSLDFWNEVEKKLRGWKFSKPFEVLEVHPFNTKETLKEIIRKKRDEAGDDAAMALLGHIISAITGAMG